MRQYETTFIVDAHLSDDQIEKTIDKLKKFVEDAGARIDHIDRWGKRRLAYEIAKKQYGYYVFVRFKAEETFVKELEREDKLDDAVLRYLTVLVPKTALKEEARLKEKEKEKEREKEKVVPPEPPKADKKVDGPPPEEKKDVPPPEEKEDTPPPEEKKDAPPSEEEKAESADDKYRDDKSEEGS